MTKCETRKLGERSFVEAEGDSLQILSEAKLLFSELIRRFCYHPFDSGNFMMMCHHRY